jgi:hypothetical protein
MTPRERFLAAMNFRPFDRLPLIEWAGWWGDTIQRWHREGMPVDPKDFYGIHDHFGLDRHMQDWIRALKPGCPAPDGARGIGIVQNRDHYEKVIRPQLFPRPAIDRAKWEERAALQAAGKAVLWFTVDGFYWFPRRILGTEPHLFAFYDDPALITRINEDLTDWIRDVFAEIFSICTPDFMTFAEDMSYNNGSLLSKELFDTFLAPYYRQLCPILKKQGTLILVDSDGDITAPAHWFESVGVEGILPLERQAGVDINRLRADHPAMRFIGQYDKMVMNKGEAAMRREFERLVPAAAKGGFLISCDHQTPPGVSYEDYTLYIRLFREYADEAGRLSRLRGP